MAQSERIKLLLCFVNNRRWYIYRLYDVITIVATPTTIVANNHNVITPTTIVAIMINHNCRNTNHKCRNFLKKYCVFIIDFVQNYDISISYIFQQSLLHFSPLNYEKLWNTVAHHETILQLLQFWYWNCENCEIFKIIAVSYE